MRVASPNRDMIAEFVLDAGMLCCSLQYHGEELLDLGRGVDAYAARGATMGIPLLYPWANRLEARAYRAAGKTVELPADNSAIPVDPNGLPIHGVVPGLMRWRADERDEETRLTAHLAWTSPSLLALFPYAHEARVQVSMGDQALTVTTTVRAVAEDPVPVSFGYHPYLRLPAGDRDSWQVTMPRSERLVLDERMIPTDTRARVKDTAFDLAGVSLDDAFKTLEQPARFTVTRLGRGLAVEFLGGYPYAQIYAPPAHDYICFEPMTAPGNALCSGDGLTILAPGEQHHAAFRVLAWRD